MPDERFTASRTAEILQQIKEKLASGPRYSSGAYERDVTRLLGQLFPFSVLPGIRLFSSESRGKVAYGFEMDNLLHVRFGGVDYIVVVEAKMQAIEVEKGRWYARYDGEKKCTREQVDNHIRTMWEYLKPIARNVELKFVAVVVSSSAETPTQKANGYRNADVHLCSIGKLPELLADRFNFKGAADRPRPEVLRVSQSGFLDLLRLSLPVEQLGHPELASAIRYVDRCRRTLDEALFQRFEPKPDRWVINGSAGMGKSVLLAYTAAVLSSGYEVYRSLGAIGVKKASETFATMGFDPDPKRGSIAIMAMSAKQLENLRGWFNLFVEQFQQGDTEGVVRFRPPEFLLCRPGMALTGMGRNWTALLVDEAHDLPPYAAREIVELYARSGLYLVVACDRHQKLRLAGSDAKIIEGLDFTNRSTRLRQIYRNPAPIYIASLALMFRWFAKDGPKVIPNLEQMREQFGFETSVGAELALEVAMRSDAHPANSWCHTVATFPDVASAYAALAKEKLGHKEVLWVRFSEEDQDFDYEQLIQRFTYHNCRNRDAYKISDKYIKGQDYPIVVIEGFPGFMDRYEAGNDESARTVESRMWAFRRELYLCASRATAFLYFVCNVSETAEVSRIRNELQHLVAATATPENPTSRGTKSWKFVIHRTAHTRNVDVFADTVPVELSDAMSQGSVKVVKAEAPVTIQTPNQAFDPLRGALLNVKSVEPQPIAAQDSRSAVAPAVVSKIKQPDLKPVSPDAGELIKPSTPLSTAPGQAFSDDQPQRSTARLISGPVNPSSKTPTEKAASQPSPSTGEPVHPHQKPTAPPKRLVVDLISGSETRKRSRAEFGSTPIGEILSAALPRNESSLPSVPSERAEAEPIGRGVSGSAQPLSSAAPAASKPTPKNTDTVRGFPPHASLPKPKPVLHVPKGITVRAFAEMLGVKPFVLIGELMERKIFASLNQSVDPKILAKLASSHGFLVEFEGDGQPAPGVK